MAQRGTNKLANVLQDRMQRFDNKPPILDFGTIQEDMSLITNKFPLPIPYEDYVICRSVCYDPSIPLTLTWWFEEGWNKQVERSDYENDGQKEQPQEWKSDDEHGETWHEKDNINRWGELINPDTDNRYWDEKHKTPPITGTNHIHSSKGEHNHEEDVDGKHYHDTYLPRKMYRIQPGDRVLVAWVGDDAVVIDIVMKATEMM